MITSLHAVVEIRSGFHRWGRGGGGGGGGGGTEIPPPPQEKVPHPPTKETMHIQIKGQCNLKTPFLSLALLLLFALDVANSIQLRSS